MAGRARCLGALWLGVSLWFHVPIAFAQQPDDPLPPGTKSDVRDLKSQVLDLKVTVLDLHGFDGDAKGGPLSITGLAAGAAGAGLSIAGRTVSLGAAIQDLRGAASGVTVTETPNPPPRVPAVAAAAPPPRKEIKIYLPADVLFDFDKADLRPEAATVLDRVASVLKSDLEAAVTIEGHTDGKGNDKYNQPLSERRADSVRQWLVAHGATNRMASRGWGKTKPIAPNTMPNGADNPDGRQKNRRVEITFTTAQ